MKNIFFFICFFFGAFPAIASDFTIENEAKIILQKTEFLGSQLSRNILMLSLKAYQHACDYHVKPRKPLLTIIDYSKPSSEKRLWIIDLDSKEVLFHSLVAHGKNSGLSRPNYFSNDFNSRASSLGVFLTGETYYGKNGYSLRLQGLEKGFNDHAKERTIVIHPAWYASDTFLKQNGRLGCSWGCPALNPKEAESIINTIKNGTVVFIYFPNKNWLSNSIFLQ